MTPAAAGAKLGGNWFNKKKEKIAEILAAT
jgi:hypothetical protein